MKTVRSIFISISIFAICIYCLSTLGTKIYVNNINDLTDEDIQKLSQLSVEVDYIQSEMESFNSTKELQDTDVSLVKEYIAEFLDSKNTMQQFLDFIKQAYRGGDILLMALPYEVYDSLDFFIEIYRVVFIAIIVIAFYIAIRTGQTAGD